MVKHILGQAVFQSIVILTILFAGAEFIPEQFCHGSGYSAEDVGGDYCDSSTREAITFQGIAEKLLEANPDYYQDLKSNWDAGNFLILMGMQQDVQQRPIYKTFEEETPSRHLTIVFNLFVFMQIFNMICSRKINDQLNIFDGILENPAFVIVWIIILVVQILCAQLFGRFVSVHINGLTALQWVLCIVISLVTFPINLLLKYCPDQICPTLGDEDPADVEAAAKDYQELMERAKKNENL